MRSIDVVGCAGRVAGAVLIVLLVAACSRNHGQPQEYGLGSTGAVASPGSPQEFSARVGDTVHFTEDSSSLSGEAQGILRNQARWLNQYRDYTITIEGHADERGTREYNLALGARRATAVKSFLAQSGVNAGRMRTISYGKERPIATCDQPVCWNQNRRAHTALNTRAMASGY